MQPDQPSSNRTRALLSTVMFGVLLFAVGVAWLVTESRATPIRNAEQILRDLRAKGLPAILGTGAQEHWYVAKTAQGKTLGWRVVAVGPCGGGYQGIDMLFDGTGYVRSQWRLANDLSRGDYQSATSEDPYFRSQRAIATIELRDGKVTVQTNDPDQGVVTGTSPAPANYVPEGMMETVARLTAKADKPCVYRMIIDQVGVQQSTVRFLDQRMTPMGASKVKIVNLTNERHGGEVYSFDANGSLARQDSGEMAWDLSTAEAVYQQFPDARDAWREAGAE